MFSQCIASSNNFAVLGRANQNSSPNQAKAFCDFRRNLVENADTHIEKPVIMAWSKLQKLPGNEEQMTIKVPNVARLKNVVHRQMKCATYTPGGHA